MAFARCGSRIRQNGPLPPDPRGRAAHQGRHVSCVDAVGVHERLDDRISKGFADTERRPHAGAFSPGTPVWKVGMLLNVHFILTA
jgi:hypothetical protein